MIGALSSQIYAKDGADDDSSSGSSGGQESESRGRESENEQRGQEFEAERGGVLEVRGQEFEAERGGANEIESEMGTGGITFEIKGTIASVSNNTLTILGRTITRGTIPAIAGQAVKIEGVIDNGAFLAREIKPLEDTDRIELADDGTDSSKSKGGNRGLIASIGNVFGSIISSMINLFR